MHGFRVLCLLAGISTWSAAQAALPPDTIAVPQVAQEDVVFTWVIRGRPDLSPHPYGWEQGKVRYRGERRSLRITDTWWAGGETINLPRGTIECLSITAFLYRHHSGRVEALWQYRWGNPSRLYAEWNHQKVRVGHEPPYC